MEKIFVRRFQIIIGDNVFTVFLPDIFKAKNLAEHLADGKPFSITQVMFGEGKETIELK